MCCYGMHFCENPFDVLRFYPFVNIDGSLNEFTTVESDDAESDAGGTKYVTKKLKVGTKIGIRGLVSAFVDYAKK